MIKANDFRKGNYVMDKISGEWMVIEQIGESIIAATINRDKYPLPNGWQMAPIRLATNILEKCGFELFPWGYVKISSKGFGIRLNIITFYYDVPGNGQVKIKYLHELQNLYFAITREEIEINL